MTRPLIGGRPLRPHHAPLLILLCLLLLPSASVGAAEETSLRFTERGPLEFTVEGAPTVLIGYESREGIPFSHVAFYLDGETVPFVVGDKTIRHTPAAPLAPGRHEVRVETRDTANRPLNASWAFHVLEPSIPGEQVALGLPVLRSNVPRVLSWDDASLTIQRVEVTAAEAAKNVTFVVREHRSLPATASALPVPGAKIVSVDARAEAPLNFSHLDLHFALPETWLVEHEATPAQVMAFRVVEGAWRRMPIQPAAATGEGSRWFVVVAAGPGEFAIGADTVTPRFGNVTPAPGSVHRATPLKVTLNVEDNLPLHARHVRVTVNGASRPVTVNDGSAASPLAGPLDEGRYQVAAEARDDAGNTARLNWTFIVDLTAPTFPRATPEGTTTDPRPRLDVAVSDALSGVDPSTLRVLLDGVDVTPSAAVSETGVILTPDAELTLGSHALEVHARDWAGNEAVKSHVFEVRAGTPGPGILAGILTIGAAAGMADGLRGFRRGR